MAQQITDEKGRVLGYFMCVAEHTRVMQVIAEAEDARRKAEAGRDDGPAPDVVVEPPPS